MNAKTSHLIQHLLDGSTLKDAAKAAGMPYRTAQRLAKTPEALEALRQGQREIQQAVTQRIIASALDAHQELYRLALYGEKEYTRAMACAKLLDLAASWGNVADIERRLAALEERQNATIIDQND